jgi:hypothetical protein
MPDYLVHFLDPFGRVLRSIEIECDDDVQARALVEEQAGQVPLELWQGKRLVERYEQEL